jgi:hypothetical protein
MARKHGSKAAYEASRAEARAWWAEHERQMNMTEDERRRERNAEKLADEAPSMWLIMAGLAMAGGSSAKDATSKADAVLEAAKSRFG